MEVEDIEKPENGYVPMPVNYNTCHEGQTFPSLFTIDTAFFVVSLATGLNTVTSFVEEPIDL